MQELTNETVLVTGASGQLGRRVLELLLDAGAARLAATTRTPEKIADLAARGVSVRCADFDAPEALREAFQDAGRVLMISTDAVAEPGRRIRQHRTAVAVAADANVRHVVYTSFTGADASSPVQLTRDHHGTEQALLESGLRYTALRYNLYAEALVRRMPALLSEGKILSVLGSGGVAYIRREDCARAACAALVSEDPPTGPVEISGAEAVTAHDFARLLAELTGREFPVVEMTEQALCTELEASGAPRSRAAARTSLEVAIANGHLGVVTRTFEKLTGQPPMTVAEFLRGALSAAKPSSPA